jgi:alkylhydroperoxidase/carboxymuconolactone decarboxylase family protein YurZ
MQNRLDNKQQAIIPIAAFAAKGDTEKLAAEIQHGLDTGLTINEIKEVLIQLYAYAGFPRSLNALGVLMRGGTAVMGRWEKTSSFATDFAAKPDGLIGKPLCVA